MAKRRTAKTKKRLVALAAKHRRLLNDGRAKYREAGNVLTQLTGELEAGEAVEMPDGSRETLVDRFADVTFVRDERYVPRFEMQHTPPAP